MKSYWLTTKCFFNSFNLFNCCVMFGLFLMSCFFWIVQSTNGMKLIELIAPSYIHWFHQFMNFGLLVMNVGPINLTSFAFVDWLIYLTKREKTINESTSAARLFFIDLIVDRRNGMEFFVEERNGVGGWASGL